MSLEDVYKRNLQHRTHRAGWLRAAVLGANDGLVSTASLMIGVAAAGKEEFLLTAGLAGITAGAMSMAVGEYVSVKSQNDVEASDRLLEIEHLAADPEA
jgi:VIT1/CCC1 family predicted Fe2+/Mn2+ transporter